MTMITISFYSYKGGVGRSLTLTNLAVYLAQFGARVAMVDFDLEAPGLHYKIQPNNPIEIDNRGIAGLLADVSRGVNCADLDWDLALDVSEHVDSAERTSESLAQPRGQLLLIPAGNPMLPAYWHDLATIDWDQLFTGPRRPGVAALARLRNHLVERFEPDVLLVDSRTGITPGGGVSTTLIPDVVVTMMLNTPEHLDGSRLVVEAVATSGGHDAEPPRVVPVLSRYTSPGMAAPNDPDSYLLRAKTTPTPSDEASVGETPPLDELRANLVRGLSAAAAERVADPLVLHTDLALQYQERLAFGPYAGPDFNATGQALLEDYLRLFAALVPRETFLRYVTGVRNRARAILLDRPEDAVRTLESLATLVGDEAAFVDLVKAYVLRRDTRNMLLAAERLFRIHDLIVVHPALSQELRKIAVNKAGSRAAQEAHSVTAELAERYWREASVDDVEWGAGVARFLSDLGRTDSARTLAAELIERGEITENLPEVVRVLATGASAAEELAVALALEHFEVGASSSEFLRAAALASRYHPTRELARRILDATASSTIPDTMRVDLMQTAGRPDDAGALLVEILATTEPYDRSSERHAESWASLVMREPSLRLELQRRNPEVLAFLDSLSSHR